MYKITITWLAKDFFSPSEMFNRYQDLLTMSSGVTSHLIPCPESLLYFIFLLNSSK